MPITPEMLPGYLMTIAARVPGAAAPAALSMAEKYREAVQVRLMLINHAPFTFTPSPPGFYPALISGNLRRRVLLTGAGGGGGVGYASVSSTAFYAAIQEYGHTMHAHRLGKPMTWFNGGSWWSKYEVTVPPRPYMRPTTIQMIASGALQRAAIDAFNAIVWGE